MAEESAPKKRKLVGFDNFVRSNPKSDKFEIKRFDHLEFYCGDSQNVFRRFQWGLGMALVAKSDQSTGNAQFSSYVLKCNDVMFTLTSPYGGTASEAASSGTASKALPLPNFSKKDAHDFFQTHGLSVRTVGIEVDDATKAYEQCVSNGAIGILAPTKLEDEAKGQTATISEVKMHIEKESGTVIRWVEKGTFTGHYLPNYEAVEAPPLNYGLTRVDHVVSNVAKMLEQVDYLANATGMHEFAEFTAEDVGTVDSGLNSMVLSSNNETVLLPTNEPTFGTKRKSQIQTYLEQNGGAGVQHVAIKTDDIFRTMTELKKRSELGGFEFMPKASDKYYREISDKIGDSLSREQYEQLEDLGLLADKDDQGVLLQVFTRPVGDRPTLFFEIIQRIGCNEVGSDGKPYQRGGCGGFGKGNFTELFKSIEKYEAGLAGVGGDAGGAPDTAQPMDASASTN